MPKFGSGFFLTMNITHVICLFRFVFCNGVVVVGFFVWFGFVVKSQYVVLAGLEYAVQTRLTSNSEDPLASAS